MGLIIKDKIDSLMCGYPTVSDKYNVRGATLASDSEIGHFGDIALIDGNGYFKVASATTTVASADDVAGVLLATNVKLVTDIFGGSNAEAETRPGEAFNLLVDGYVALPVDLTESTAAAEKAKIKEGTAAKITTTGKVSPTGTIDCGWKFTGITTIVGTKLLAEVVVFKKNI